MVDGKEVRTTRVSEEVISAATISGVFGKNFQTTGLESTQEAADLALLLRAGSLAAPMDYHRGAHRRPEPGRRERRARPAGGDVLVRVRAGLLPRLLQMFGVITYMALLLNLLMVVAVMSLFGATLTLPGLAGIALTVGMSVDANVLINERIREELRAGRTAAGGIAGRLRQGGRHHRRRQRHRAAGRRRAVRVRLRPGQGLRASR